MLLADPVSVSILRSLASGPRGTADLIDEVENVSRSTFFERLRDLEGISLITRERRAEARPIADCSLTEGGRCLLRVARLLDGWLARAPAGPLALGEISSTAAVKALALGWGSTLLRWLAERPHPLTELEQLVEGLGYRKLERAMRDLVNAGLAERAGAEGRLSPYAVTRWGQESVAVVAAAVRWERQRIPDRSAPVTSIEVEAGLLLALPLVELPSGPEGACLLLVDLEYAGAEPPAGVTARISDGHAIWCVSASEFPSPGASWLRGSLSAWLHAVIKGAPARLEIGGNADLTRMLVAALHDALLTRLADEPGRLFDPA